jgi:uncharacterized protein (DUF849 family)
MLIKACLNGSRASGEHPALPLTPDDLGADALRVFEAGAGAVHVHPRDQAGTQTLAAPDCDAAVLAIRRASPGLPVGLSTAIWIEPDLERRLSSVRSWTERPDFVSVNFNEPGVLDLCRELLALGIGLEAGVQTSTDVEALADSGYARHLVRVLVEPEPTDPAAAQAQAASISAALDHTGIEAPRVYHAQGPATWVVIDNALRDGWDVRIGLEDTLQMPDGSVAEDNGALVAEVVRMVTELGRIPTR